jgi:hypothetical protein
MLRQINNYCLSRHDSSPYCLASLAEAYFDIFI